MICWFIISFFFPSAPFDSCARLLGRDAQWHPAGALLWGGLGQRPAEARPRRAGGGLVLRRHARHPFNPGRLPRTRRPLAQWRRTTSRPTPQTSPVPGAAPRGPTAPPRPGR